MQLRIPLFFMLCFTLLVLSGCEKEERIGRYGMLDENTPEYTAVMFIRGVYLDENLDRAIYLSTDRMSRILERYHTQTNVQRHVFNLKYDTVEVTPQTSQSVGRTEYADSANVTLFFSGTYNGDKVEDLRTLELKKVSGTWKVDKIQADPFL
ncbi:hypothetical protein [Alteromonas lipolytica]|uniref:Lipoprotein n=1 Tax=Alteromonas lipolytica TaxID=1856405 RepID=A0A1E8FHF9_9ALTE|nr:hypothetical protein [Alteromonas lipolytica]OFI35387.1 hypothetical protein BFC17_17455 [Alteromonas lipolytica]